MTSQPVTIRVGLAALEGALVGPTVAASLGSAWVSTWCMRDYNVTALNAAIAALGPRYREHPAVPLSLAETARILRETTERCPVCHGDGSWLDGLEVCRRCDGSGWVDRDVSAPPRTDRKDGTDHE